MAKTLTWYYGWALTISPIQAERFTDASVWIGGRRWARRSTQGVFAPTWAEAKQLLIDLRLQALADAEAMVVYRKKQLAEVQALEENAACKRASLDSPVPWTV